MQKEIKIAEYIGIFGNGGIEHVVLQLFEYMDHKKHKIDFIIDFQQDVSNQEEIYSNNGRILSIFSQEGQITRIYQKALKAWYLYRLLKKEKYDIIHLHVSYPSTLLYCFIAKLAGIKVRIVQSHASDYGDASKLSRILNRLAGILFSPSATHLLAVSREAGTWMFGRKKYSVFENGIDIERFQYMEKERQSLRGHYGISDETLVIGHVGRYVYAKNHEFLIEIFFQTLIKRPDSMLILIGEGELKEKIIQKTEAMGIKNKVLMLPYILTVEKYYQVMDAFVFPSNYEGFGIVVLEAQVSGLPIWVSDNVPKETVVTGNVHHLSLNISAEEWAQNILEELNGFVRKDCSAMMRENAFDIREKSKWLENYYLKILDGSL